MKARGEDATLLPHEIVFSGFLLITWIRLVADGALLTAPAFAFLALLAATVGIILWAQARPGSVRWRVRLSWYFALMVLAYYSLTPAMARLNVPGADAWLNSCDTALFGTNLSVACQALVSPFLTDVMVAAYSFYYIMSFGLPAVYCVSDLPKFKELTVGLFTVMGLGYLGYTLWPAGGPHVYLTFERPLTGSWFSALALPLIASGSNGVDVFPSLHLGATLYLLGFEWRFARHRFWWVLAPCLLLWVSTIYLRYHYFVDLAAGAVLAVIGWWVAASWKPRTTNQHR